jgi:hypothetical protein
VDNKKIVFLLSGSIGFSLAMVSAPVKAEFEDLSLSKIFNINSSNVASLLGGKHEEAPATVFLISDEELQASTARTLTDVINKHVPGTFAIEHQWVTPMWGARGIMNDRPENFLLNVNGEFQNSTSRVGVLGEAYLGLMSDIKEVQMIIGPGSVVHGQGALAGVVNLELKDGRGEPQRQARKAIADDGGVEVETAQVLRWGEDNTFRLSAGFLSVQEKSGGYWGTAAGAWSGDPDFFHEGRKLGPNYRVTGVWTNNEQQSRAWFRFFEASYNNRMLNQMPSDAMVPGTPLKYAWYPPCVNPDTNEGSWPDGGDCALSGLEENPDIEEGNRISATSGQILSRNHVHRNLSTGAQKVFNLTDRFEAKAILGYTVSTYEVQHDSARVYGRTGHPNPKQFAYAGDLQERLADQRFRLRGELKFQDDLNPFVIAIENRYDTFGNNILGKSEANLKEWVETAWGDKPIRDMPTNNFAILGEYQNRMFDFIAVPHVGLRYDLTTWSDTLSPRFALTRRLGDQMNVRAVWQKSYKNLSQQNLHGGVEGGKRVAEQERPAQNVATELGWNYVSENLNLSAVGYQNDLVLYSWDDGIKKQIENDLKTLGFEVAGGMRLGSFDFNLSHSHVRLGDPDEMRKRIENFPGEEWRTMAFTDDGKGLKDYLENISRLSLGYVFSDRMNMRLHNRYLWEWQGRKFAGDQLKQVVRNGGTVEGKPEARYAARLKSDLNFNYFFSPDHRISLNVMNLAGHFSETSRAAPLYESWRNDYITDMPTYQLVYAFNF